MTRLHLIPDERGTWRLFDEARPAAVSEHNSATDAERSAWTQLRPRRAREIVVHDRYGRTRPPVHFDAPRRRETPAHAHQQPDEPIIGLA